MAAVRWRGAVVVLYVNGVVRIVDSDGLELLLPRDEVEALTEAWGSL